MNFVKHNQDPEYQFDKGFNWSHSPKYNIDDCDEWLVRDMNENDEHFVPLFGIDNQGCYSYHYLLFD